MGANARHAIGDGLVSGGWYVLKAPQYVTGAFDGAELVFKVNDQDTGQRYPWEEGGTSMLDLSLD